MEEKYDRIGLNYNQTRKADPYLLKRLAHHLGPAEGSFLDIGCGTGNYTIALHDLHYNILGVDPSSLMLERARSRNPKITWLQSKVEDLSLDDASFNGVTAFLTLHHWQDLKQGFKELFRVMKPAARLVIFSSTPEQMKAYWLCHYFPKMLKASIDQMPSLKEVRQAISEAGLQYEGFENYSVKDDLQDQFLQCGKNNPQLYFDPKIRQGISTFSALGNRQEVEHGLARLKEDMDSGAFEEIKNSYESENGDYLYIYASKP